MHAEDLVVDHDAEGQEIEHIREIVPDIGVAVLAGAFCVETVRLGDAAGFMISANQVDTLGVSKLEADEKRYRFDTKEATVDIVPCDISTKLAQRLVHTSDQRNRTIPRNR